MKDAEDFKKLFENFNPMWFDKEGKPINDINEIRILLRDDTYRNIGRNIICGYFISTVWLGLNESYWKNSDPVIFQTTIFKIIESSNEEELLNYVERYSTKEEAIIGHKKACELVRQKTAI